MRATVICGPPGSGKSAYLREHAKPGDIVWDFEMISVALTGLPPRECPDDVARLITKLRDQLVASLHEIVRVGVDAWFIITWPASAEEIVTALRAEVVMLDTPLAECVKRIEADNTRSQAAKIMACSIATEWWEKQRKAPQRFR